MRSIIFIHLGTDGLSVQIDHAVDQFDELAAGLRVRPAIHILPPRRLVWPDEQLEPLDQPVITDAAIDGDLDVRRELARLDRTEDGDDEASPRGET